MKLYTIELDGLYASGMALVAAKTPEHAIELTADVSQVKRGYLQPVGEARPVGTTRGAARVVDSWSYIE